MKTKTLGLFAIPVIAAIMIGVGASTQLANADPDGSNPESASITRDFGCSLFDGNDNVVAANGATLSVFTRGEIAILTCMSDTGTPTPDGKSHVMRGFNCGTFLGGTTVTVSIVTPDGHSTLICKVNLADQNP